MLWCAEAAPTREELSTWRSQQQGEVAKHNLTLLHLFPYGFTVSSSERHSDAPVNSIGRHIDATLSSSLSLSLAPSAVLLWSEAEGIVPERAEAVRSVPVGAVPVGLGQPVVGRHPNVQDLGVSTRHCQSAEGFVQTIFYFPGRVVIGLGGPVVVPLILLDVPIGLHRNIDTVLKVQEVVCGNVTFLLEQR